MRGLGLDGAIAINLYGAGVLVLWLLFGDLDLTSRRWIVLRIVALVVLGIGAIKIAAGPWTDKE